jgi:DNA-binding CsgD family transcriptional regulator
MFASTTCQGLSNRRASLLHLHKFNGGKSTAGLIVDQQALISLYGLTRAEAALTAKLLEGKSPEAAALDLRLSATAIKKHMKRIAMKTAHRQPEFIMRVPIASY